MTRGGGKQLMVNVEDGEDDLMRSTEGLGEYVVGGDDGTGYNDEMIE